MNKLILIATLTLQSTVFAASNKEAKADIPKVPPLTGNQLAYYFEDKYNITTLKSFEGVSFSESCFKNEKPQCDAYKVTTIKTPNPSAKAPHESMTHPGALFCKGQGGTNLVALNSTRQEIDLCRFKDGSLVSSWDLYFKFYPPKVIK